MSSARKLAAVGLLCLVLIWLWAAYLGPQPSGINDFAAYWTAARQLCAHENPYSPEAVLALERQLGYPGAGPLIMRNPPWALPFVLPFGLLPYALAEPMWFSFSFASIAISIALLWPLYGGRKQRWLAWMVSAAFLPIATVLRVGQIAPLMLLGISGFLACESKQRDATAGAFALLVALKPHLAFLFWPALLLWAWSARRWRIPAAFFAAICIASLLPMLLDRHVFSHYQELWNRAGIIAELTPTPSGTLRLLLRASRLWVEFLPGIAAVVWVVLHWLRVCGDWRWSEQLPLLLLVSLATTPYGWFFDEVILVPAVLQVAAVMLAAPRRKWLWLALIYFAANSLTLGLILARRTTFWYAWTGPLWLVLYLLLLRCRRQRRSPDHPDKSVAAPQTCMYSREY